MSTNLYQSGKCMECKLKYCTYMAVIAKPSKYCNYKFSYYKNFLFSCHTNANIFRLFYGDAFICMESVKTVVQVTHPVILAAISFHFHCVLHECPPCIVHYLLLKYCSICSNIVENHVEKENGSRISELFAFIWYPFSHSYTILLIIHVYCGWIWKFSTAIYSFSP